MILRLISGPLNAAEFGKHPGNASRQFAVSAPRRFQLHERSQLFIGARQRDRNTRAQERVQSANDFSTHITSHFPIKRDAARDIVISKKILRRLLAGFTADSKRYSGRD